MIAGRDLIERIRKRHGLDDEAQVGIVSSFGTKDAVTVDEDQREIVVIANTDDMDLDREVVVPEGIDWAYFQKNRSVFADHQYDLASTVGKMRRLHLTADKRAWRMRVRMLKLAGNPLPDDILTIAREFGIGMSIGFEPLNMREPNEGEAKRYGDELERVVDSAKGLEVSFTAMPCNVACQSMQMRVDDTRAAALDELVTKSRIARASAVALGLPDTPERRLHPTGGEAGRTKGRMLVVLADGSITTARAVT